ncbi:hypothetical protein [Polyangium sp. 15x6]|uniref:hypothetical protein n=1 Tax=Polyangium sp. 15x6 TaxID=3042687 RepID=UPI00249A8635|nr:hypothetical protein [Polyangium sp. 15x6]MDI3284797.1 hypothetical protein [Polyangium sp. 15x6]
MSPEEAGAIAVVCIAGVGAILAVVFLALFTDAGPEPYVCILVILLGTPFALRMVDDDAA